MALTSGIIRPVGCSHSTKAGPKRLAIGAALLLTASLPGITAGAIGEDPMELSDEVGQTTRIISAIISKFCFIIHMSDECVGTIGIIIILRSG